MPASASARLGETAAELEQRYGKPLKSESVGKFTRNTYKAKDYAIVIVLDGNMSVVELFTKPDLTKEEAVGVIQMIARTDPTHYEFDPHENSGTYHVSEDRREIGWTLDHFHAHYTPAGRMLVFYRSFEVFSAYKQATAADANKGL